jgi:hypothetical protein
LKALGSTKKAIKSLENPLYRPKKEIVPTLSRNLQSIVFVFRTSQSLAKRSR